MQRRRGKCRIAPRLPDGNCAMAMIRIVSFIVTPLALWGCFALWYRVPGGKPRKILAVASWAMFILAALALSPTRLGFAAAALALAFCGLLLWWHRLMPSNDRDWADDVAAITSGTVAGNRVVLRNVRNFDWRTDTDYTQRWESRCYELDKLDSVDMIMSYWTVRAIAHVLISFGFGDGDHVVFSVEIRREKWEAFSAIGGFFKKFELSIVAADERDAIRLRTNVRREDDYLYRIRLPKSAMRSLFLAYVEQANKLAQAPRFYNTVTVNCTTLIYHMMNHIVGNLPWDYRLLFSGYLAGYVYKVGGLDTRYRLDELRSLGRITERAHNADRSETFSADIRQGVPRVDAAEIAPTLQRPLIHAS
jgi:hypothetical protein